jgi:hypothetical protein
MAGNASSVIVQAPAVIAREKAWINDTVSFRAAADFACEKYSGFPLADMRTLRSVGRDEAGRHVVLDDLALALESHRPHFAHRIVGILAMAAAGGSGMFLWKSRKGPLVDAKKKRMPFIAAKRVTPYEAMKMITPWGAEQFGEQATKGSIEEGKTVWFRSDR